MFQCMIMKWAAFKQMHITDNRIIGTVCVYGIYKDVLVYVCMVSRCISVCLYEQGNLIVIL